MDWTQETKLKSREAELIFDIRGTYIEVLPPNQQIWPEYS